jgi:hypothetical protein
MRCLPAVAPQLTAEIDDGAEECRCTGSRGSRLPAALPRLLTAETIAQRVRKSGISREFLSNFANRGVRDSRYREGGLAPWVFVAARVTYIDL